jgi:hypothetical protein
MLRAETEEKHGTTSLRIFESGTSRNAEKRQAQNGDVRLVLGWRVGW